MSLSVIPCAFHSDQYITNFCKSQKCLLPMCPKCIKVHAQEHKEAGSFALFESISLVVREVEQNCINIQRMMQRCTQQIMDMQQQKKKNQTNIKQKLSDARNRIVRQFDRYMTNLENQLLNKLNHFQQTVVIEFRNIDKIIQNRMRKTQDSLNSLYSERCLKTIINFFSGQSISQTQKQFSVLQQKISELSKKNVELIVDESEIFNMGQCLSRYLLMSGADLASFYRNKAFGSDSKLKESRKLSSKNLSQIVQT